MATGEARMADAASLPPRSALPRDVDIPVLPGADPRDVPDVADAGTAGGAAGAAVGGQRLRERGFGTPAG
jgi:hypothetical protein